MKRFVITGYGRTATKWLAMMLDQHPDAAVQHEPFKLHGDWKDKFEKWLEIDAPVVGMVNSYARFYLRDMGNYRSIDTWAFVWREPCSLVRSVTPRRCSEFENRFPWQERVRMVSRMVFGDLEIMLDKCKYCGIEGIHWGLEEYTTLSGFIKLSKQVGLEWGWDSPPKLLPPQNTAREKEYEELPSVEDWDEDLVWYVENSASLPNVGKVYQDIWERTRRV